VTDLDQALERFQLADFEYGEGLSNHGPMAAEALVALGHSALVTGLVHSYAARLPDLRRGTPMDEAEQAAALGCRERLPDWLATYEARLEGRKWRDLLREALPRLVPGLAGAATHGLLRTAHAVRALEAEETPARRRELAFGLAYWAGCYEGLPGHPGARPQAGRGPAEVLEGIVPLPLERRGGLLLSGAMRRLVDEPLFVASIESVDLSCADPGAFLSALCASAAGLYLENLHARIAYVHAVTGPSALRLVAPYLAEADLRRGLGAALQVAAALHAVSARVPGAPGQEVTIENPDMEIEKVSENVDEIRYRAACSLQEHAIKFAEACLREDAIAPDARLRLAAAEAAVRLTAPGWGKW